MGAEMMNSPFAQRGMLMVEVMVALIVFSIGVLGMVKMQAISTSNSTNSEDRTTAALLSNDLISELWAAQSAAIPADYASWQTRVTNALRSGTGTLVVAGNQATVTITWSPQGRADNSNATYNTQVVIQ